MGIAYNPSSRCPQGQEEHRCIGVNSLPPELLIHTFNFSAAIDTFAPLRLGLVCRRWNSLVSEAPTIYQCIRLSETSSAWNRNLQLAKTWVERSYPLPFDVFVDLGLDAQRGSVVRDDSNLLGMLSPFYENLKRWRRVVVDDGKGTPEEYVLDEFFRAHLKSSSVPDALSFLNVSICDLSHEDSVTNVPKGLFIPPKSVNGFPVTLIAHDQLFPTPLNHFMGKEESESQLVANYIVSGLPTLPSIQTENILTHPLHPTGLRSITTLNLSEHSVTLHISPSSLLSFLTATPNLQKLTFVGWIHADRHAPSSTLPVAHLPKLNTLQLRSTCLARSILSCLYVPGLERLELAHLNVDFEMPLPGVEDVGGAFVSEAFEQGDSEDEAGDFSQSPWSDRSTGMGLRALMRRSNPPLKVLSMDFTDMRTKDFIWLFPRLEHLEEFAIVASDMSDTVIKLLKPHHEIEIVMPATFDAMDMDMDTARGMRLILPKLKTLELYNCHRLTGEALVDVLVRRAQYTDALPEANTNTLKNLAIVGCDGFWHRHAQVVLKELGSEERNLRLELS
ncbi:hypothetical protein V5O48_001873 [Marasmius crinis-equi]|uniref:F-box domain-containing protein n=1 Tax=Marasmius crinis-equi TaxID=585013 RepID=A0ABR3FX71_9AGAR